MEEYKYSLSGKCRGESYYRKMKQSKVCISPWGLGEICFRDFEGITSGAILIKPDMGFIETWPQIYSPWETYVPCKPDWSDLEDVVHHVISKHEKFRDIAFNAFIELRNAWNNKIFAEKFDEIMKKIEI